MTYRSRDIRCFFSFSEAKGDLDEEAREDDNIEKNCSKDIAKLGKLLILLLK